MNDRVFLAMAGVGALACAVVHTAALLGAPAGFEVSFLLMAGCILVWWRALVAARKEFGAADAKALWSGMAKHSPAWVMHAFHPLVLYFGLYWAWVLYVAFGQKGKPSAQLMSLFYSAGAFVFYVYAAAFLRASGRSNIERK